LDEVSSSSNVSASVQYFGSGTCSAEACDGRPSGSYAGHRERDALGGERVMKKTRFSEEQMVKILREADHAPVREVAKKHRVSDVTINVWRKRYGQLEAVDVKRPAAAGARDRAAEGARSRAGSGQRSRTRHPAPVRRHRGRRAGVPRSAVASSRFFLSLVRFARKSWSVKRCAMADGSPFFPRASALPINRCQIAEKPRAV